MLSGASTLATAPPNPNMKLKDYSVLQSARNKTVLETVEPFSQGAKKKPKGVHSHPAGFEREGSRVDRSCGLLVWAPNPESLHTHSIPYSKYGPIEQIPPESNRAHSKGPPENPSRRAYALTLCAHASKIPPAIPPPSQDKPHKRLN